jgi:hypothetical protein
MGPAIITQREIEEHMILYSRFQLLDSALEESRRAIWDKIVAGATVEEGSFILKPYIKASPNDVCAMRVHLGVEECHSASSEEVCSMPVHLGVQECHSL